MKEYSLIVNGKPNKVYTQEFIENNRGLFSNSILAPKYLGDFIDPHWNGSSYYEGLNSKEIREKKNDQIISYLDKVILKIKVYIKSMAMAKSINDDLDYYEEAYTNKYNLCVRLKCYLEKGGENPDPFNTIATEAQLEGQTTFKFINNVIDKFEQGKAFNDNGIQLIECLRKRIYLDLDQELHEKAMSRLKLIDDLPATITPADVASIYQQVMSI
ncbi:hypothetical protein JJC03_09130 [Flavobacterium oreochromis]|uniref:hypothetical protein n=1 Tax=Flavobacterium oreochromis TaxID=2906078 RepID=UPI001CE5A92F|nr:hypothetical protein [Flavobacterium oreochromis]QYS85401.1 hypothetical protein JJC03_09130 [Flavobacterium oreochromis]